jgi:hypothetical protein
MINVLKGRLCLGASYIESANKIIRQGNRDEMAYSVLPPQGCRNTQLIALINFTGKRQ